jgi:hypothetical protein
MPAPASPRSVHSLAAGVVGGHEVPLWLVVGLSRRVEGLSRGVVEDVAVRKQVEAGVEGQRLVCGCAVVRPLTCGRVVGLGLHDVPTGVLRGIGIDRLDELSHAAGDERRAVAESHHCRIPAAEAHLSRLRPGVGLGVEDSAAAKPDAKPSPLESMSRRARTWPGSSRDGEIRSDDSGGRVGPGANPRETSLVSRFL